MFSGGLGYPLTYEWSLDIDLPYINHGSRISINSKILLGLESLTITLTVENHIGNKNNITKFILIQNAVVPEVYIFGQR